MSNGIQVTVSGNLTADPELRTIGSGASVVNFTIASAERKYDREARKWVDGAVFFMRCTAWRDLADHVSASLSKGMAVIATGRLGQRTYEAKDGSVRTVVELTVEDIGSSLLHATSQTTRATGKGAPRKGWSDASADPSDPFDQPDEW